MWLMREIRFSVGPESTGPILNSWAGWPPASIVTPYLVLRAWVEGTPDPLTGYICNIKQIDSALREIVVPLIAKRCSEGQTTGEQLLTIISSALVGRSPQGTRWTRWEILLTPYLRFAMDAASPNVVQMTQSFEFSASHRLHAPSLSDEENRRVFGKCNNPGGHGHNYQLEVTIAGQPDTRTGNLLPLSDFERIVKHRVVDRLDHKHLNSDCIEFTNLNPSVENISRVIWSLLNGHFEPARLACVRVWETPKTYAECNGA